MRDLPALIRLKYVDHDEPLDGHAVRTRWRPWSGRRTGTRADSRIWRELLSGYGVDDVLSTVFRDQYGCWAFLDLWRIGGTFSDEECAQLQRVVVLVTSALRQSLARTFAEASASLDPHGPAVLLLSRNLELLTQTPQTDAYLRSLLPTEPGRSPVPAGAYHVAAQLLAQEEGVDQHPPSAHVHLRGGLWMTFRAARIEHSSSVEAASIAVSIEPTPPAERAALYARVVGLSEREAELVQHLVGGHDTRAIANRMYVSEHTVQDHLKSVFAKAGVNNRRLLTARNGRGVNLRQFIDRSSGAFASHATRPRWRRRINRHRSSGSWWKTSSR